MPVQIEEVLDELQSHWQRLELPLSRALRGGLSQQEIDGLVRVAGIDLPEELVRLYAWHDGVDDQVNRRVYGFFEFLPLAEALDDTQLNRDVQQEISDESPPFWPDDYLKVFRTMTGAGVACRCRGGRSAPTRYFDWEDGRSNDTTPFDSPDLRTLLGWWLAVYEADGVRVNRSGSPRRSLPDEDLPRAARNKLHLM